MKIQPLTSLAWSGLSPDLLRMARRRVRTVARVMLGVMACGSMFDLGYARVVLGEMHSLWIGASVVGVLLSLALVLLERSPRVSDLAVLRAALVYEVVFCFMLAILIPWFSYVESGAVPYVTWVSPLIIFFPLIVPSPPRTTLVTAIAAATTRPLGLVALEMFLRIDLSTSAYLVSLFSPAFAVVLAYTGSRVVHGISVDLSQAQRMGSYELVTKLGEGGMGEVWRARHQLLARPAAIKLIRPETLANDPDHQRVILSRFEREAQATAQLTSPHTVHLYDFGITDTGTFYYVMELLHGLDLDALVTRFGPLPAGRTVALGMQVCESLGEAHEHALVHRDIKPANIYVCRYGRRVDHVKVLDFGLVKFRHGESQADPGLSIDGRVTGTPAFIAPEQVMGQEADARTDIYQLGCVLYWMLTGATVFKADSPLATMMMHVQATPDPPSRRTELPVSAELDRQVLACLEKDPARRPQNVDNVADMLAHCEVDTPWTTEHAHGWWDLHCPSAELAPVHS